MAIVSRVTTKRLMEILGAETGLAFGIAQVSSQEGMDAVVVLPSQLIPQNAGADLVEKSAGTKYPAFCVYCEKVSNLLTEKFRTFSGKSRMVVEVRVSQDRLEGLDQQLQMFVDAVTTVLDMHRGDWGGGLLYAGGYEVNLGPVKHGGKNFLQTAKVSFDIDVSVN
jgi:hypothetical protein